LLQRRSAPRASFSTAAFWAASDGELRNSRQLQNRVALEEGLAGRHGFTAQLGKRGESENLLTPLGGKSMSPQITVSKMH
jgi:hypothetical protein